MKNETFSTSLSEAIQEIEKLDEAEVDSRTQEGLQAVSFANSIVNSILRRNKVDLAFFRIYMEDSRKRLGFKEQKKTAPRNGLKRKRSKDYSDK